MLYFKKKYLHSLTPYIENYNIFMNIVDEKFNAIQQFINKWNVFNMSTKFLKYDTNIFGVPLINIDNVHFIPLLNKL